MILFSWLNSSVLAIKSASIVMCAESGKIHHEQNADVVTYPASLTKMMTLYLTFKAIREGKLSFEKPIVISKHASKQAPCKLWLKPGSTITVRQAILALVTKSANDAAVALAEALGNGSEARFAQIMTNQASELGMTKTIFKNASGLPNKHQVTTARDMAILSRSLYKHYPREFAFFKEQTFNFRGQKHRNHNHLLGQVAGVDGIKTGFINASGFNLAASMVRDNKRIVAVVMGGQSAKLRDKKMIALLEATHRTNSKGRAQNPGRYATIGDLIHTLGPSEAKATPLEKPTKATYRYETGQVRTLDRNVDSLDELIKVIDSPKKSPKLIKAKATPTKAKKRNKHIIKAKSTGKRSYKTKATFAKKSSKKIKKRRNVA